MKAFILNKYTQGSLQLGDVPTPILGNKDVLVEVHAASINQLDSKIKTGELKLILPYKFPFILGHDVAGRVIEIGAEVSKFKVGDEVYARPADFRIGTFAEYIAIDESDVALKPKNISFEAAASIPLVGLTAWQAFVERGNLKKGQKVFIQAGSGGVGTIAIQLAKYLGAIVATTTSAKNSNLVRELGADVVIDYRNEDFELILKDYDLVLNSQDSKTLEKSLNVLKRGGKIISISEPPTPVFAKEFDLPWYVRLATTFLSRKVRGSAKKLDVDYEFLFMKANGIQLDEITRLIEAGTIRPVIDQVFPFEQTNSALQYIQSGRSKGKVVIKLK